jgi:hypothetical protein
MVWPCEVTDHEWSGGLAGSPAPIVVGLTVALWLVIAVVRSPVRVVVRLRCEPARVSWRL